MSDVNQFGLSKVEEKRLYRRIDLWIIPFLGLLYLISFIDRVNIGQAKLDGITSDLNMTSSQFQTCNTVFYATYVAFEILGNFLTKRFGPSKTLPLYILTWGIVLTLMGIVHNFEGLLATRIFLGVTESGLFPSCIYIVTMWYPRKMQAVRMGFLFSGAVLAGAFGGVLAYALSLMDGVGGQEGWRWIFIIEGLFSFCVGILTFFLIQDLPSKAKFLNENEKAFVIWNLKSGQGPASLDVPFSFNQVLAAFKDYRLYLFASMYYMAGAMIYSLSTFSPSIIQQMGTWDAASSKLLTVPPFVAGFIFTMLGTYYSDRSGNRAIVIFLGSCLSAIGYLLIVAIPARYPGARYFSIFLMVSGFSPAAATVLAWTGNSFGPVYKRGCAVGFVMSVGNSGGIISAYLYPQGDAPEYTKGNAVCLAFSVATAIVSAVTYFLLRRENKIRDEKYGTIEEINNILDEYKFNNQNYDEKLNTPDEKLSSSNKDNEEDQLLNSEFVNLPNELIQKWNLQHLSKMEIAKLGDRHPLFRYIT